MSTGEFQNNNQTNVNGNPFGTNYPQYNEVFETDYTARDYIDFIIRSDQKHENQRNELSELIVREEKSRAKNCVKYDLVEDIGTSQLEKVLGNSRLLALRPDYIAPVNAITPEEIDAVINAENASDREIVKTQKFIIKHYVNISDVQTLVDTLHVFDLEMHEYIADKVILSENVDLISQFYKNIEKFNLDISKLRDIVENSQKKQENQIGELKIKLLVDIAKRFDYGHLFHNIILSEEDLNYELLANSLIEEGCGCWLAMYIDKFKGIDSNLIANQMIDHGFGFHVAEYKDRFGHLEPETLDRIANEIAEYNYYLRRSAELRREGLTDQEILDYLIEEDEIDRHS